MGFGTLTNQNFMTVLLQVKTLHQACINPKSNMEDIEGWLDKIFGFTTINEVMNFAAELGVFVFYEVDVEKSPLRMVSANNECNINVVRAMNLDA